MIKFKIGDTVKVTLGKDKGREGKISNILPKRQTAVVPELNMYKRHIKGVQGQKGGIYDLPRPLAFSKIALICPKCKKMTRVGFKVNKDEKLRICRKCGREIDTK